MFLEDNNLSRKQYLDWIKQESGVNLTRSNAAKWSTLGRASITSGDFNKDLGKALSGYPQIIQKELLQKANLRVRVHPKPESGAKAVFHNQSQERCRDPKGTSKEMTKLKIMVNFDFLKWFHAWVEDKKQQMEDGELKENLEYRRRKNKKLVGFMHRINKDGTAPSNAEVPVLKK
jgi:hypothetical protein